MFLIAKRIVTKIISIFINIKILKYQSSKKKYDYIFYSYNSNDLNLFYYMICETLSKFDKKCLIVFLEDIYKNKENIKINNFNIFLNNNFNDLLKKLKNYKELKSFYVGFHDFVIRFSDLKVILNKKKINNNFIKNHLKVREISKKFATLSKNHIVTDSSYTFNNSLKYFVKKNNNNLFIINQYGDFYNLKNYNHHEKWYNSLEKRINFIKKKNKYILEARKIISNSIDGKLTTDKISRFNFKYKKYQNNFSENKIEKKVLLLHCFRDANMQVYDKNLIFHKYIDWVSFVFNEIKNKQDDWYIKIHPSINYYSDEKKILSYLQKKFSINSNLINDCPGIEYILKKNMPIFTGSGTTSLQSVYNGIKAVVYKDRFNEEIVYKVKSKIDLKVMINLNINELRKKLSSNLNDSLKNEAALHYYCIYKPEMDLIKLKNPIIPTIDRKSFLQSRYNSSIEIIKNFFSKKYRTKLDKLVLRHLIHDKKNY